MIERASVRRSAKPPRRDQGTSLPIYCYKCQECGHVTEVLRLRASAGPARADRCDKCGALARRDYRAEAGRRRNAETGEIRSVAAGVMPEQAAAAERECARRGIDGVRFDRRTGDAVFANRRAKLRAIAAMGLHDRDEIRG